VLRRKRSSMAATETGVSTKTVVAAEAATRPPIQTGECRPSGLSTASVASIGAGVSMAATTRTTSTPATRRAHGRQRGEGSEPSGKSSGSSTGTSSAGVHPQAPIQAASPPSGSAPGCTSTAVTAYWLASASTASTEVAAKTQPTRLSGRRLTRNAPVSG
jgi:hypothetical protein